MKTRFLIEILRCPRDGSVNCEVCKISGFCQEALAEDMDKILADRLEKLLDNLRRTEAELKDYRFQAQMWEKRHKRFLSDIREAVHEQEIITGYDRS